MKTIDNYGKNLLTLLKTKCRIVTRIRLFCNFNSLLEGYMNADMHCQVIISCESFSALIACERLFSSVRPHVTLQFTACSAIVSALVTLVRLFFCMLPHHVNFQMTICNAGKQAHRASVGLLPGMGLFVQLEPG